jgi:hypothetical protein
VLTCWSFHHFGLLTPYLTKVYLLPADPVRVLLDAAIPHGERIEAIAIKTTKGVDSGDRGRMAAVSKYMADALVVVPKVRIWHKPDQPEGWPMVILCRMLCIISLCAALGAFAGVILRAPPVSAPIYKVETGFF